MKFLLPAALWALALLPLAAKEPAPVAQERERVYLGMVADERSEGQGGLLVRAVAPGSPAQKAGLREGDLLLRVGKVAVNSRSELRELVSAGSRGSRLSLELQREGRLVHLQVELELRPVSLTSARSDLGADRHVRPIELSDSIREQIRQRRRNLRAQLRALPDNFDPQFVSQELQAIRDLARDARASRPGWMAGRAGEISVRFRDTEGSVILYGANNLVTLELCGTDGQLLERYELNTPEERRAIPAPVLERLQRFR